MKHFYTSLLRQIVLKTLFLTMATTQLALLSHLLYSQPLLKELVYIQLLLSCILFSLRNLLKGIGQQMKWSVRDESLHSKMGCKLFRHMCEEDNQLLSLCREDIIKAAETMVDLEVKYIEKMFEMGDIEGISV